MALQNIQINGSDLPKQPSELHEWTEYQQTDKFAIDDSMQRNRVITPSNDRGLKYMAEMSWDKVNASEFAAINNLFVTGSGVLYSNPDSKYGNLTYSGLPFIDEGRYERGESKLSSLTVRIRQV